MDLKKFGANAEIPSLANLETFDSEILSKVYERISWSEMRHIEKYFLNGLIRKLKPKKLLEVGVSAGASSCIMLNAIHDAYPNAKLYSVDLHDNVYYQQDKEVGYVVKENFPEYLDNWILFAGQDISGRIEQIGEGIDFCFIDTGHIHPIETLNFLCVLPFIKKGSWVVIHDVELQMERIDAVGAKYLYNIVTSENKIRSTPEDIYKHFSNIGAFQLTDDTYKYIYEVFYSLTIPWRYFDDRWHMLQPERIEEISAIIEKYYSKEMYECYLHALEFQYDMQKRQLLLPLEVELEQYKKG